MSFSTVEFNQENCGDNVELHTAIIPAGEHSTIKKIVEDWFVLAKSRSDYSEAISCCFIDTHARTILRASKDILCSIFSMLDGDSAREKWDSLVVCKDTSDKIQAIALVNMEQNKLVYLATHPNNIVTEYLDKEIVPVRGAASRIIVHMAKLALESNRTIRLKSTDSAFKFYKKLGFKREEPGYGSLKLSVRKIQKLISMGKAPFDQLSKYAPASKS